MAVYSAVTRQNDKPYGEFTFHPGRESKRVINHPATHLPTHPPSHSLTYPLTQPLTYPPIHLSSHSLTHPPTRSLSHPLTHAPTHSLTHPLAHPPIPQTSTKEFLVCDAGMDRLLHSSLHGGLQWTKTPPHNTQDIYNGCRSKCLTCQIHLIFTVLSYG